MTEEKEQQNPVRILMCEDDMLIAEDLAGALRDLGHQIAGIASTGEEAVRLAEELQPTLILLDIEPAGRDGRG